MPKLLKKTRAVGSPKDCPSPSHRLQKAAIRKCESRFSLSHSSQLLPFVLYHDRDDDYSLEDNYNDADDAMLTLAIGKL